MIKGRIAGLVLLLALAGCGGERKASTGKEPKQGDTPDPTPRSAEEVKKEAVDQNQAFEQLGREYLDKYPALSPIYATGLGDHRFDSEVDQITVQARAQKMAFYLGMLRKLKGIDPRKLEKNHQIDYQLLRAKLNASVWSVKTLREWAWNPMNYTGLAGSGVYNLMARDFAPVAERLERVTDRLEKYPALFEQIRATLEIEKVPEVHAQTAVKQNRGVLSVIDNMVTPLLEELEPRKKQRLQRAIDGARQAVEEHQQWLEEKVVPGAKGDFRLGPNLFDRKLAHTLNAKLTRQEIKKRALWEIKRTRGEMYRIARSLVAEKGKSADPAKIPTEEEMNKTIRAALERAYQEVPDKDKIIETAKQTLQKTTDFVRQKDLVTIPSDPIDIIVMPEFRRGIALAYCDSPGPLDVGQKTFYAVSPMPEDWTPKQVRSYLREYNLRSIYNLTIHEAMPGHFLQLAHSNKYPSKLRAVLSSGVFIEGWAVYTEQVMRRQGFLDGDPLMKLIVHKWYLRAVSNALIDQAVHTEGMTEQEAMKIMTEDTFQEEREAAGKWTRAQLTSTQLSTYFVGYLEHADLRRDVEKAWGDRFSLKKYHDAVLANGSPPVRFVRALVLDQPVEI